jgi:hypothetical protein
MTISSQASGDRSVLNLATRFAIYEIFQALMQS